MVARPADDEPSEQVIDELARAFAADDEAPPTYDLDDPRIDELLGIEPPEHDPAEHEPAERDAALHERVDQPEAIAEPGTPPAPEAPSGPRRIVIEESDLPDPVYLDQQAEERMRDVHAGVHREDLDATTPSGMLGDEFDAITIHDPVAGRSGGPRIEIGDLDVGVGPSPVSTSSRPNIDPRVRARRVAVGRARGRRRLLIIGTVLGALVAVIGTLAVLGSSWFDVRTITVQGAPRSRDQLEAVLDQFRGKPVLRIDTLAIQDLLETQPWVERAIVETDFPHGLTVDVRERVPAAYYLGSDQRPRVVDTTGRVLEIPDVRPSTLLPLTGAGPDLQPGSSAGSLFGAGAEVAASLPAELQTVVASVGVNSTTGDLTVLVSSGTTFRLGPPTDLTHKLARMLKAMRDGLDKKFKQIDVSTSQVATSR